MNSEPIREDQVQNAVKFLSHPKVKGSPVMYRRSFLERKGLTKEEIDEAFRRVPVRQSFFLKFPKFYILDQQYEFICVCPFLRTRKC